MATVKLINGTRKNSVLNSLVRVDPNDPKRFVECDFNLIDVIGVVAEIRGPGNPTTINLINHPDSFADLLNKPTTIAGYGITDHKHMGGVTHYSEFDATGHLTMAGDARPWRDELGDVTGLRVQGVGITENFAEGTKDFLTSAALTDYLYCNVQLNHDKDLATAIYPHVHWFQVEANTPNWLLQYRWQIGGVAKVTAWTSIKCNTNEYAYPGGTISQLSYCAAIAVPVGTGLSDIVQFRVLRDNAGADAQYGGVADPYTVTASMMSFDVHLILNSIGSTDQDAK